MKTFQHALWGYEISYPDQWIHHRSQDIDLFAAAKEALDQEYRGSDAGQIQVRGEWNWTKKNIEPLWNQHIGMLASLFSAANVGSAPWRIGDATGVEAEILLPKKENMRLWTGILMHEFIVLHFMVSHPIEVRKTFEPEATQIISSLKFSTSASSVVSGPEGIPLPPDYLPADPNNIVKGITQAQNWYAFTGQAEIGALQAFYLRELTRNGWEIDEYVPYPFESDLGFARYKLQKEQLAVILGLMPAAGDHYTQANIVYKKVLN